MRVGAGLSTAAESRRAAGEAAREALRALRGEPVSLCLAFASTHHGPDAMDVLDSIHEAASPETLIGCVAEAVVGGDREIEGEPAVSVLLVALPGPAEAFHMEFARTPSGGALAGWRFEPAGQSPGPRVHLLLCDPFSFPADLLLRHLNDHVPGTIVMGGMAGGAPAPGGTVLFMNREIHREGAVGVRLPDGVAVRTIVSQGCRPIGPSLAVTAAQENVLLELGGRPPLERLRETVGALSPPDRELAAHGLHLGRVIDEYKPEHGQGDFLVRNVVGADPNSGAIAVADRLEVGETVRFHVRDAATADEELRTLLEQAASELPARAAGALLFTCNGRGTRMFDKAHHDARLLSEVLGAPPAAGFFCAGELGPVGGKNFLHGFTASVALFVDAPRKG